MFTCDPMMSIERVSSAFNIYKLNYFSIFHALLSRVSALSHFASQIVQKRNPKYLWNTTMAPQDRLTALNALPLPAYRSRFFPSGIRPGLASALLPLDLAISLESASTLSRPDLVSCFDLMASTCSADYADSSIGWSPAKKRKEMRLPDLRYLLLKQSTACSKEDGTEEVVGFLSFMLTYEDGFEIVYCYEVHLRPYLQGKGIGKQLVLVMEEVGRSAKVKKAMLTVFVVNEAARKFYDNLGYEEDDFSPRPRKLRDGIVKRPNYTILSKPLMDQDEGEQEIRGKKRKAG